MQSRRSFTVASTLAAAVLFLAVQPQSHAQFAVEFDSGAPVVVSDNGVNDLNPAVGVIQPDTLALSSFFPGFNLSNVSVISDHLLGSLALNATVDRTDPSATIAIIATDTDYTSPAGNPKKMASSVSSQFNVPTNVATTTFQSYFDPSNTQFGMTMPSPLITQTGTGVGAASSSVANSLGPQPVPYSLTVEFNLTLGEGASLQSRGSATITAQGGAVPEPGPMALIAGAGLAGCLFLRRRA